jgi:hypothetical protein
MPLLEPFLLWQQRHSCYRQGIKEHFLSCCRYLTFVMRDSTCIEQSAISLLKHDSISDKKRENKKSFAKK